MPTCRSMAAFRTNLSYKFSGRIRVHDVVTKEITCQRSSNPSTRRASLLTYLGFVASISSALPAQAVRLRSLRSDKSQNLRLINNARDSLFVFWINYDGDQELLTVLDPGEAWSSDSYETHVWLVKGANDERIYAEFAMGNQDKVVSVQDMDGRTREKATEQVKFDGFDGLGGKREEYRIAELDAVAATERGPVALVAVEGSSNPLTILMGPVEGTSLALGALGITSRRPRTAEVWSRSLKEGGVRVERALITRLVGNIFYARLILLRPDGFRKSLDARPSDVLTLAVEDRVPIYVASRVMLDYSQRDRQALQASQPSADNERTPQEYVPSPPLSMPSVPSEPNGEPQVQEANWREAFLS